MPGARLVEEHDLGPADDRGGEREALALAAGQAADGGAGEGAEPEPLGQLAEVARLRVHPGDVGEHLVRADAGGQAAVLQHHADARPQVARLRERVAAEHADGALVGLAQALAALDRGGLARTVGAEHRGHLAAVGDEVEPVDDGTTAVALDEPGDLERGGVGHEREV